MKTKLIFILAIITRLSFGQANICDSLVFFDYPPFDSIKEFKTLDPVNLKDRNLDTIGNFNEVNAFLLSENILLIKEYDQIGYYELPYISRGTRLDSSNLIDLNLSGKKELILYYTDEYYHVSRYDQILERPIVNNISSSSYSNMLIIDVEQKKAIGDFVIGYFDKYTRFYYMDSLDTEISFGTSREYYESINLDSLKSYIDQYLKEVVSSKTSQGECEVVIKESRIIFDCSYNFSIVTRPTSDNSPYIRNDSCEVLKTVNYDVKPESLLKTNQETVKTTGPTIKTKK